MFNNLSDRILKTFDGLLGKGVLTEDDVNVAMREVRVALLEADVPLKIAKEFHYMRSDRFFTMENIK